MTVNKNLSTRIFSLPCLCSRYLVPVQYQLIIPTCSQGPKLSGNIDVWWLYDDGGLTLLLPYILTTRHMFADCKLRVFTLANKKDELDRETRNMAALLAKFRIEFSSVVVIPGREEGW